MSSEKKRNKEDTWKADELGKSIKEALSDTLERKHKHKHSKKSSRESQRKKNVNEDYQARDKHVRKNQAQRLHDQSDNDKAPSYQDRTRSEKKDEQNQQQDLDKHANPPQKENKNNSVRTGQEDKKRGKHQNKVMEKEKDLEPPSGDECDEENYDDDFEDYEDDFEDINHHSDYENNKETELSEVAALRRAMEEENMAILRQGQEITSASSMSSDSSNRPGTTRSRQTFINFTAAKQRQINTKLSRKTMQRGSELMNLIELDISTFSLLEMTPVKVYELYIKAYGRSNTKQAFVQCHEDILDREIQTEAIEKRDAWTQYPSQGTSMYNDYHEKCPNHDEDNALYKVNSLRLTQFLENASQVMNAILEEGAADYRKCDIKNNQRSILFSQGYTRLHSDFPFLRGRYVKHAQFHPVQTNLLMTVYSMPKVLDDSFSNQAIICVWNINDSSQPYRILTCKPDVTTCCFSPIKSAFAFAGTIDGAILVWDLRESSSMHHVMQHGYHEWYIRVPTYSTNGVHKDEAHQCAVVTVQPITTSDDNLQASIRNADPAKPNEDMHGLSFQLASLDEHGVIHFWVVIELDKTESAGSVTDLGLVPSGKVKLIRSSSIVLENYIRKTSAAIQAQDMKFALNDPNHFFVATDTGILHGSRHGDRVSPKCYKRLIDSPVDVVQLDFSPFGLPYFLAASTDGCICLYSLAFDLPLLSWSSSTGDLPIVSIAWSRSRPSVFYVVDVTSKVYVWELLASQGGPVKTEQFSHGRLMLMELSNDHAATGRGMEGSKPAMIITDDSGAVDVHAINHHFSVAGQDELEQMVSFLNTFS